MAKVKRTVVFVPGYRTRTGKIVKGFYRKVGSKGPTTSRGRGAGGGLFGKR